MERLPSVAEGASDWRSNRPRVPLPEPEHTIRRRGSGFSIPESGAADQAEVWTKGGKFVPSAPAEEKMERQGSLRGKPDAGHLSREPSAADEGDWRRSRTQSNVSREAFFLPPSFDRC